MDEAVSAQAARAHQRVTPIERSLRALVFASLLASAACSDDGDTHVNQGNVGAGPGGTTSGTVASGVTPAGSTVATQDAGAATGAGTPGGAATGAGTPGGAATGPGTPAGTTADGGTPGGGLLDAASGDSSTDSGLSAGADSGMPGQTDGGAVDTGMPPADNLKTKCQAGTQMGCKTFMSPSGMEIELGPYGAAMDTNMGKGFENSISALDNNTSCASFAAQFGQSKEANDKLLDLTGVDLKLYTVYRPANWVAGEKYPIVSWGNGTCAKPEGYGALLRYVASHGFLVVAPNSRYVGSGAAQKRAIDYLISANMDSASPYYQKVDATRVAAMGHSQGSQSTIAAASDSRIDTVLLFNVGQSASKPFFAISGDRDIAGSLSSYKSALASATRAAYMWMHMVPGNGSADGHLTLMLQPERLTGATVAWLKSILLEDVESKTWFSGSMCKLCGHNGEYEFAAKGI